MIDSIRTAYKSKMRLWADSDEEVEGRWFRAAPNAKFLGFPCPYMASTWRDPKGNGPGPGEIWVPHVRYDKGTNSKNYTGDHTCGSEEAMRHGGVHGRDPVLTLRSDGVSTCCWPPGAVPPLPPPPRQPGRLSDIPVHLNGSIAFGFSVNSGNPPEGDMVIITVAGVKAAIFGTSFDPVIVGFTRVLMEANGDVKLAVFTKISTGAEPDFYAVDGLLFYHSAAWCAIFEDTTTVTVGGIGSGTGNTITALTPAFDAGTVLTLHVGVQPLNPVITPEDTNEEFLFEPAIGDPNLTTTFLEVAAADTGIKRLNSTQPYAWLSVVLECWH